MRPNNYFVKFRTLLTCATRKTQQTRPQGDGVRKFSLPRTSDIFRAPQGSTVVTAKAPKCTGPRTSSSRGLPVQTFAPRQLGSMRNIALVIPASSKRILQQADALRQWRRTMTLSAERGGAVGGLVGRCHCARKTSERNEDEKD